MGAKGGGMPNYPAEGTFMVDPISHYQKVTGKYPSNSQVWYSMKRPPELGTQEPPKQYLEVFDPSLRFQLYHGNSMVARGHFIYDAFRVDRTAKSGIPGIPVESTEQRPNAVGFFAGRVFYAGVYAPGFNTKIYFSQLIERDEQIGMCYQVQDPTSEVLREALPTDGGVIEVPEIDEVIALRTMGDALLIFASNGVWSLSGSSGMGFTATDFAVGKLSGVGSLSPLSFVDVEGSPVWWNRNGVWTIVEQEGRRSVTSLTEDSIKSLIKEIPEEAKRYVKGSYDPVEGLVYYMYNTKVADAPFERMTYSNILVLDTKTGSWTPWSISNHPRTSVKGVFNISGTFSKEVPGTVYSNGDTVKVDLDSVISPTIRVETADSITKYIININEDTNVPGVIPPTNPVQYIPVLNNLDNVMVNLDRVVSETL